eukprot:3395149-Rhodomonas_salina.1
MLSKNESCDDKFPVPPPPPCSPVTERESTKSIKDTAKTPTSIYGGRARDSIRDLIKCQSEARGERAGLLFPICNDSDEHFESFEAGDSAERLKQMKEYGFRGSKSRYPWTNIRRSQSEKTTRESTSSLPSLNNSNVSAPVSNRTPHSSCWQISSRTGLSPSFSHGSYEGCICFTPAQKEFYEGTLDYCVCGRRKDESCHQEKRTCRACGQTFTAISNGVGFPPSCTAHSGQVRKLGMFRYAWSCCLQRPHDASNVQAFRAMNIPHFGYHTTS